MRTRSFCLLLLFCALSVFAKAQGYYSMPLDKKKILLIAEGSDFLVGDFQDTKSGELFNRMLFPGLWAQLDADDKKVLGIEAARKEEDIIVLRRAGVANLYNPVYSSISWSEDEEKLAKDRQEEIDRYIAKHYTVYVVPAPDGAPSNPIPKGKYPYLKPGVLSGKVKPGSNTSTVTTSKPNVIAGNATTVPSRAQANITTELDGIIKELAALFKKTEGFTYYDTKNKENITYVEQTFTKDLIVQRIKYENDIVTFKYEDMPWKYVFSVSVSQTQYINKDLYHVFVKFKYAMDQAVTSTKEPTPSTDTTNDLILEIKKEDVETANKLVEKLKAASDKSRS